MDAFTAWTRCTRRTRHHGAGRAAARSAAARACDCRRALPLWSDARCRLAASSTVVPQIGGPQQQAAFDPFLDDLEARTFRFFWETANPKNGLVPDRYPTPSYASIAAVGFGLTAYPIGADRGYISRAAAGERVLATLRFFSRAANEHGFFYHFLDMSTGERANDSEVSTVDTALLLAGVLFCQSYFNTQDPQDVKIRKLADQIYRRVDWTWAQPRAARGGTRVDPGTGVHRRRLARLQRGDARVPARDGFPHPPHRPAGLGVVDQGLRRITGARSTVRRT